MKTIDGAVYKASLKITVNRSPSKDTSIKD